MIVSVWEQEKQHFFYASNHLGNNHVVANANGDVVQRSQFYPFGTAFAGVTTVAEQGKQPYKYNGKELDQMHGLNLYDYSARYYESAIGRFTTVDPHAENYYSWSPYVYALNNSLRYTDPTGMSAKDTINGGDLPVVEIVTHAKLQKGDVLSLDGGYLVYYMGDDISDRTRMLTVEHLPLPGGGSWKGLWKVVKNIPSTVKNIGTLFKTTKSFKSVKDLISSVGKLERLKGGVKQGEIVGKGSAGKILRDLAKEHRATIQTKGTETFFQSGNIRVGMHTSTRGGAETIHINDAGQLYKIRVTP